MTFADSECMALSCALGFGEPYTETQRKATTNEGCERDNVPFGK